jgi:membrane protease YdiL (CAAX protease family)
MSESLEVWLDADFLPEILPQLFMVGVALAIIYFMTGNLLMAVGAHALADAYMQIPRDVTGFEDDFDYLYIALALVFAMVLRARLLIYAARRR